MAATGSLKTSAEPALRLGTHPVETIDSQGLQPWRLTEALAFAATASKHDGYALGWLPLGAIIGAHNQQRLVLCYNNGDPVGFIIWAAQLHQLAIYYLWVRKDARLILHGMSLVEHAKTKAARHAKPRVGLWCARDLEANIFWHALGFEAISWRWGRAKNPRRHWLWVNHLDEPRTSHNATASKPSPALPTLQEIRHFVGRGA